MQSDDYRRRSFSRAQDLTLAYPYQAEDWLEGGYPEAELGMPAAQMAPQGALDDVQALGAYLRGILPDARQIRPAPPPRGPINRRLALARLLMHPGSAGAEAGHGDQ